MIIRKTTAILAAIFLVTIVSQANAKLNEFCGDRYCGQYQSSEIKVKKQYVKKHSYKKRFAKKIRAHAFKSKKSVQVANIGNEPLGEAPRSTGLLAKASSYLGGNPTGWRSLWCARFIAFIAPTAAETLKRMGLNPNWARDYAKLRKREGEPQPGDIVVLTRGNGGHIGVFEKFDKRGNPIIISGNHGHKVGKGTYSKGRVIAYVTI